MKFLSAPTLSRNDASNEGGQLNFAKSLDNTTGWYIDVYGSTSTPVLRFISNNGTVETNRMSLDASDGSLTLPGDMKISGKIYLADALGQSQPSLYGYGSNSAGAGISLILDGGAQTVIGAGESATAYINANSSPTGEDLRLLSDNHVFINTNIQDGWSSQYQYKFTDYGTLELPTVVKFTGSISGTTLSVASVTSGILAPGQIVTSAGAMTPCTITAYGTGTGGAGTYTVSVSQTVGTNSMYILNTGFIDTEDRIAPTLQNGWANYSATVSASTGYTQAAYWKDRNGVVHLTGLITGSTVTADTLLFTLPVGYRPYGREMFGIINNSQTPNARVDILANGDVRIGGAAWSAGFASLAGISFKAER